MINIDIRSLGFSDYVEVKVTIENTTVELPLLNNSGVAELAQQLQDAVDTLRYMSEDEPQ